MIHSANHKLSPRILSRYDFESLNHGLQALVGPPLSKSQDAMVRVSTLRKIRVLGPARQHPVITHVNRAPAIFVPQNAAISRQQDRD